MEINNTSNNPNSYWGSTSSGFRNTSSNKSFSDNESRNQPSTSSGFRNTSSNSPFSDNESRNQPSTSSGFRNTSSDNESRNEPSTSTFNSYWGSTSMSRGLLEGTRDITHEREMNGSMKRKRMESLGKDECKDGVEEIRMVSSQFGAQRLSSYQHAQPTTKGFAVDSTLSNFMMPQYNIYNTIDQYTTPVSSVVASKDEDSPVTSMNPYLYTDPPDPSMYEMIPPVQIYSPMPMMKKTLPDLCQKTVKVFTRCILYPPPPSDPPPSRRVKPNSCMTVFVRGLPDKITEDILKEVFSECGEIDTIRTTKKNFCLVKFTSDLHADKAFVFSDYRIVIENKDEPSYNGRLHVDYALTPHDKYKCECIMRKFSRAARHANMEDPFRPLLANTSGRAAFSPEDQLHNEEEFLQAAQVLTTSLEQRNRHKRNPKSELIRLSAEKTKLQEENELLRNQLKAATNEVAMVQHEDDKKNAELLEMYHLMKQNYIETKKKLEGTVNDKLALETSGSLPTQEKWQHYPVPCNSKCNLASKVPDITENEIRLVTLIATFLTAYPSGVSINSILSFLVKMDGSVDIQVLETLLKKFELVFKEVSTGSGDSLEKKWTLFGFKNLE